MDLHCEMIMDEYREKLPVFEKMQRIIRDNLEKMLRKNGILVTAVETRIKSEKSLAGKLELKGEKYHSLEDLTDIAGARIITFYSDDVDKISALAEQIFEIDWQQSVDKRKMHELDSFGYLSLHYICRIPESLYKDDEFPEINKFKFELQMRTALQHVWANMNHDIGYKTDIEVPREYLRSINRLAGMLELADDEFSRIRQSITEYRRKVEALVKSGKLEEVELNGDTFRSYLEMGPFDKLLKKIAAINQAEIMQVSILKYLKVFSAMGFSNLGELDSFIREYSDDAYQLALSEIGGTDLDFISSAVAVQDLCVVKILKEGNGQKGLEYLFEILDGPNPYNAQRAERIMGRAAKLPFMRGVGK